MLKFLLKHELNMKALNSNFYRWFELGYFTLVLKYQNYGYHIRLILALV